MQEWEGSQFAVEAKLGVSSGAHCGSLSLQLARSEGKPSAQPVLAPGKRAGERNHPALRTGHSGKSKVTFMPCFSTI